MAISTLDGVLAGMQYPRALVKALSPGLVAGRPHSFFYLGGSPGAAAVPSPGVAGAALTSYAGQIPFTNPVAGSSTYLARLQGTSSGTGGTLVLCDRLWHNSGLSATLTTAQTVNSVAWPPRDALGTSDGTQVLVAVEVTGTTGAGTPTFTMGYTDDVGVAGMTASGILTGGAASSVGSFYPMALAPGDVGVRSIQNFTLSASWTSGGFSLVAYREVARLDLPGANLSFAIDALTGGFPQLFNNSVLFAYVIPNLAVGATLSGQVVFTQG